jgi:serine/threonine protein kinase
MTAPVKDSTDETIDGRQGAVRLGSYVLRHRLAHGGMAEVYLAQKLGEEGFTKWVAIKVILGHLARDERFVRMFLAEARLAARIDHPNVCAVFDLGQSRGTYFLAMEYLHGQPLSSVMQRAASARGVPVPLAVRIVADAARGLHAAHELRREDGSLAEVIHRDVSPQNIFVLYSGAAKVVDFGIARSNEAVAERTATGELKGKISYMAPEQVRGGPLDRRADIWALGVVLWELLVGRRLFKRDHEVATGFAVLEGPIPAPSTARPGIPPVFDGIVLRALARDRGTRYAQTLDLARDLEAALAELQKTAGHEEIADLMTELFAREQEDRRTLLRELAADVSLHVDSLDSLEGEETLQTPSPDEVSAMITRVPPAAGDELPRSAPAATASAIATASAPATPTLDSHASPSATTVVLPVSPDPVAAPSDRESHRRARRWAAVAMLLAPLLSVLAAIVAVRALLGREGPVERRIIEVRTLTTGPEAGTTALAAPDAQAIDTRGTSGPRPPVDTLTTTVMTPRRGPRPGHATLMASPNADVYLGTRRLGRTPIARVDLPPGRHTLRFIAPGGLPPQSIDVEIRSGGTTIRNVRWREIE